MEICGPKVLLQLYAFLIFAIFVPLFRRPMTASPLRVYTREPVPVSWAPSSAPALMDTPGSAVRRT